MSGFEWDDRPTDTIRELLDAAVKAMRDNKAREFLTAYRQSNPEYADVNLGYVIGYLEPRELRMQMYAAYALQHPVFGGTP